MLPSESLDASEAELNVVNWTPHHLECPHFPPSLFLISHWRILHPSVKTTILAPKKKKKKGKKEEKKKNNSLTENAWISMGISQVSLHVNSNFILFDSPFSPCFFLSPLFSKFLYANFSLIFSYQIFHIFPSWSR